MFPFINETLPPDPSSNDLSVLSLLQLMRTRSVAEVRIGLEFLRKKDPEKYRAFCDFYQSL